MLQKNPPLVQVDLKQAQDACMREQRPLLSGRAVLLRAGACVSYARRLGQVISSDEGTNVNTGEALLGPFDRRLEDPPQNPLGCTTGLKAY